MITDGSISSVIADSSPAGLPTQSDESPNPKELQVKDFPG